jgi:hypothetical protein
MCDFVSWKQDSEGNIFFLTDKDVFSPYGRETLGGTRDHDVLGHGAITAYFGDATRYYSQYENKVFWNKQGFPPQIAVHLESPKTLLQTWGRMLKQALQPDDALFILANAPEPWNSALRSICINHITKGVDDSYDTLVRVRGLTTAEKDALINSVVKEPRFAYKTLWDVTNLTKTQKDVLIQGVIKDPGSAYQAINNVRGLTKRQINILTTGIAQSAAYAYRSLFELEPLTKTQINILVKGAAENANYAYGIFRNSDIITEAQRKFLRRKIDGVPHI